MKTVIRTFSLSLILCFAAMACSKNNEPATTQGISSDEAADEVGATLSTDVSNSATDLVPLAKRAGGRVSTNGRIDGCGVSYDTTINRSYTGAYLSYSYTMGYSYSLSCTTGGIPSALNYTLTNSGTRSGIRLESQGSSTGSLSAAGFEISKSVYTVNGSITRSHTSTQKSGAQKTFTSQSQSDLTNLVVDKSTKKILSGTATVTASGTSSGGGNYNYSATVTFNGDGTANYTINSSAYVVNLTTGQVTKK
jgi:hypothetical protein